MEKIINIGSHKTGTTSLIGALKILGYKTSPEWFYSNEKGNFKKYVKDKKGAEYLCDYITKSPFNLYEDSPYNFKEIYKEIFQYNNDFKFILTIMEENSWFSSLLYSTYTNKKDLRNNIQLQYLYGDIMEENKEKIISIYNQRNNEIIDFFSKKQNFCIINVGDPDRLNWHKLTTFLNVPDKFKLVKDLKYPHLNKRK